MGYAKSERKHLEKLCFHPSCVIATQAACIPIRYKLTTLKAVRRRVRVNWRTMNKHVIAKIIFKVEYSRYKQNLSPLLMYFAAFRKKEPQIC
jgi:hypothetical protein